MWFFRKGTLNCVYIGLKRQPSNLTLDQCKFDLANDPGSMCQRCRNFFKVYIIRLVLMWQSCLCYIVVTLDGNYHMTSFLLAIFQSFMHRRRNPMAHLEPWGNFEQETCAFYVKMLIWKFDLTLICRPSTVRLNGVIGSNDCHHRYLRAKWPRKHVSHGMFVTFTL